MLCRLRHAKWSVVKRVRGMCEQIKTQMLIFGVKIHLPVRHQSMMTETVSSSSAFCTLFCHFHRESSCECTCTSWSSVSSYKHMSEFLDKKLWQFGLNLSELISHLRWFLTTSLKPCVSSVKRPNNYLICACRLRLRNRQDVKTQIICSELETTNRIMIWLHWMSNTICPERRGKVVVLD